MKSSAQRKGKTEDGSVREVSAPIDFAPLGGGVTAGDC